MYDILAGERQLDEIRSRALIKNDDDSGKKEPSGVTGRKRRRCFS